MMGIKGLVLAVTCITYLHTISALTSLEHKKLEFPDKQLIFDDESSKDGKFAYATCTRNKETKERNCQAVLERSPYSDDTKSCGFKIKLKRRSDDAEMDLDKMSIFPFGENKAVVYVIDENKDGFMQFNTINFDDCKVVTYELSIVDPDDNEDNMIIVPHKDGFDLYAYNHKVGNKYHVVKFDSEGVKQDLPLEPSKAEKYPSDVRRLAAVSESKNKGMFYIQHVDGKAIEYEFMLRKPDGSDTSLGKQEVYEPIIYSANNDLIGVCFKMHDSDPQFNCTQHNLNGEQKFNINPMGDDKNTAPLALHNLPDGGMLIFVGSCEPIICSFYEVDFSVIKVDATGATVGMAKLGKVKAVSENNGVEMSITFHKNKDNHDCVSVANFESTATGRLTPGLLGGTDYCLTDDDFKK